MARLPRFNNLDRRYIKLCQPHDVIKRQAWGPGELAIITFLHDSEEFSRPACIVSTVVSFKGKNDATPSLFQCVLVRVG